MQIRFAVGQCSLGAILVAQSQRGICAILLGDDPEGLVEDLQDQFPKALLIGGDAEFELLVAQVVGSGAGVRRQPSGSRDPLPSGRAPQRRTLRLSLGSRAQARTAEARGGLTTANNRS
jgi:O6-methylguanine-DNA--protein-cysteine methyltransferase